MPASLPLSTRGQDQPGLKLTAHQPRQHPKPTKDTAKSLGAWKVKADLMAKQLPEHKQRALDKLHQQMAAGDFSQVPTVAKLFTPAQLDYLGLDSLAGLADYDKVIRRTQREGVIQNARRVPSRNSGFVYPSREQVNRWLDESQWAFVFRHIASPSFPDPTSRKLAQQVLHGRVAVLPQLADALQDAGYDSIPVEGASFNQQDASPNLIRRLSDSWRMSSETNAISGQRGRRMGEREGELRVRSGQRAGLIRAGIFGEAGVRNPAHPIGEPTPAFQGYSGSRQITEAPNTKEGRRARNRQYAKNGPGSAVAAPPVSGANAGVLPQPAAPAPAMGPAGPVTQPTVAGPAQVAFSPNLEDNLSFEAAWEKARSGNQKAFRKIAEGVLEQLGIKGKTADAIGDWEDGAENSILQTIDDPPDRETIKYAAAWYGLLGNQRSVLLFYPQHDGQDSVYTIQLPTPDVAAVRKSLSAAGIPYRTIVPKGEGVQVVIYDHRRELRDQVAHFAGQFNAAIREAFGSGEYVGGGSRTAARSKYRSVIDAYEAAANGGGSAAGVKSRQIRKVGQALRNDYGGPIAGPTPVKSPVRQHAHGRVIRYGRADYHYEEAEPFRPTIVENLKRYIQEQQQKAQAERKIRRSLPPGQPDPRIPFEHLHELDPADLDALYGEADLYLPREYAKTKWVGGNQLIDLAEEFLRSTVNDALDQSDDLEDDAASDSVKTSKVGPRKPTVAAPKPRVTESGKKTYARGVPSRNSGRVYPPKAEMRDFLNNSRWLGPIVRAAADDSPNETVRSLARQVLDGQVAVLPILADAIEDHGGPIHQFMGEPGTERFARSLDILRRQLNIFRMMAESDAIRGQHNALGYNGMPVRRRGPRPQPLPTQGGNTEGGVNGRDPLAPNPRFEGYSGSHPGNPTNEQRVSLEDPLVAAAYHRGALLDEQRRVAQYARTNAPAGGVVVRGIFYPGGKYIPNKELEKASWKQYEQVRDHRARYARRPDGSTEILAPEEPVKYASAESKGPDEAAGVTASPETPISKRPLVKPVDARPEHEKANERLNQAWTVLHDLPQDVHGRELIARRNDLWRSLMDEEAAYRNTHLRGSSRNARTYDRAARLQIELARDHAQAERELRPFIDDPEGVHPHFGNQSMRDWNEGPGLSDLQLTSGGSHQEDREAVNEGYRAFGSMVFRLVRGIARPEQVGPFIKAIQDLGYPVNVRRLRREWAANHRLRDQNRQEFGVMGPDDE